MGARVFIAQRVSQHVFAIDHNGLRQGCIQFKRCAMENQMYKVINVLLTLIPGLLGQSISMAEESDRPTNLTLESFQFGPFNRWTFSPMREVIPTVNIPRHTDRFLILKKSDDNAWLMR